MLRRIELDVYFLNGAWYFEVVYNVCMQQSGYERTLFGPTRFPYLLASEKMCMWIEFAQPSQDTNCAWETQTASCSIPIFVPAKLLMIFLSIGIWLLEFEIQARTGWFYQAICWPGYLVLARIWIPLVTVASKARKHVVFIIFLIMEKANCSNWITVYGMIHNPPSKVAKCCWLSFGN